MYAKGRSSIQIFVNRTQLSHTTCILARKKQPPYKPHHVHLKRRLCQRGDDGDVGTWNEVHTSLLADILSTDTIVLILDILR
jgi:hypothetical protein